MKQSEILQTVTHYLSKNTDPLEGALPTHRHFIINGKSTSEHSYADTRIAVGTAFDIIADLIENGRFFGWYNPNTVDQANASGNARIIPLKDGDRITGTFQFKLLNEGLYVAAERVEPIGYLDILRTQNGFIQTARILGIEGDLEKIASALYKAI